MKLLLTGQPGTGKTTLLEEFLKNIPNKQGFITKEVRKNRRRTGFELVSSTGQTSVLANITSSSDKRVSKYGVEVDKLNEFLARLPEVQDGSLLYVDEIGQMELFSDEFKDLVIKYLDAPNHYTGTVTAVYSDEFTERILTRRDIILLKLTSDNRDDYKDLLKSIAGSFQLISKLDNSAQPKLTELARQYANGSQLIQLNKLFKNAVKYAAEDRVSRPDGESYLVEGNTATHKVKMASGGYVCDCDLFNGSGIYAGKAGECSHIQAVKIGQ